MPYFQATRESRRNFFKMAAGGAVFAIPAESQKTPHVRNYSRTWDPTMVDDNLLKMIEQIAAHNLHKVIHGRATLSDFAESQALLHLAVRHLHRAGFAEFANTQMKQWQGNEAAAVQGAADYIRKTHGIQVSDDILESAAQTANLRGDYITHIWPALTMFKQGIDMYAAAKPFPGSSPAKRAEPRPMSFRQDNLNGKDSEVFRHAIYTSDNEPHFVKVQNNNNNSLYNQCQTAQYQMVSSYYSKGYYTPHQAGAALQTCSAAVTIDTGNMISGYGGTVIGIGGAVSFFGFPEAGEPVTVVGGGITVVGFIMSAFGKMLIRL